MTTRRPSRADQVPWWKPVAFFAALAAISVTPRLYLAVTDRRDRRNCRFANDTHQED